LAGVFDSVKILGRPADHDGKLLSAGLDAQIRKQQVFP
jgi:hypothetical protein